jgi:hypothetical protein
MACPLAIMVNHFWCTSIRMWASYLQILCLPAFCIPSFHLHTFIPKFQLTTFHLCTCISSAYNTSSTYIPTFYLRTYQHFVCHHYKHFYDCPFQIYLNYKILDVLRRRKRMENR